MKARLLVSACHSEWRVPILLILLSLVPAIAGVSRVVDLGSGAASTPATARFFDAPAPVILHILAAIPYSILGALQFAPAFRHRRRGWHRAAGRVLGACGLVVAISGLWMAHFYPWPSGDGVGVYVERLLVGAAMLASLVLGIRAATQGHITAHGAWMTRAYALGMGAGTQVLTHLPYHVFVGQPDETARAVLMGAAWLINILVAERAIRAGQLRMRVTHPQPVAA